MTYNRSVTRKYLELFSVSSGITVQFKEFICVLLASHKRDRLYVSIPSKVVRNIAKTKTTINKIKIKIKALQIKAPCNWVAALVPGWDAGWDAGWDVSWDC